MKQCALFLLLFILAFAACKKDNPQPIEEAKLPPTPIVAQKKFSCNIDSYFFETDSTTGIYYIDSLGNLKIWSAGGFNDSTFVFLGYSDSTLFLDIPLNDTIGFNRTSVQLDWYKNGIYRDNYFPISGYIYLTAHDSVNHLMSGKFDAWLTDPIVNDTVHISNGRFTNLHYEIAP